MTPMLLLRPWEPTVICLDIAIPQGHRTGQFRMIQAIYSEYRPEGSIRRPRAKVRNWPRWRDQWLGRR